MPNASRLIARLKSLYQSGGIGELWRRAVQRLSPSGRAIRRQKAREDADFDAAGYDTGGVQYLHQLDTVGENGARGSNHVAVPPADFAAALALVDLDLADLTFVDFGSGKGRALLMAAERPFRRIIGIEFARELHEAAVANFACRAERSGPDPRVELHNIDATVFHYPDAPMLLFLFNPFDPPVIDQVADHALATWRRQKRDMRIVYMNPVFGESWLRAGWRLLKSQSGASVYGPPAL